MEVRSSGSGPARSDFADFVSPAESQNLFRGTGAKTAAKRCFTKQRTTAAAAPDGGFQSHLHSEKNMSSPACVIVHSCGIGIIGKLNL